MRRSLSKPGSIIKFVKPIIPFSGVRISWFMLVKKAVFNLSLSSDLINARSSSLFLISRILAVFKSTRKGHVIVVEANSSNL